MRSVSKNNYTKEEVGKLLREAMIEEKYQRAQRTSNNPNTGPGKKGTGKRGKASPAAGATRRASY